MNNTVESFLKNKNKSEYKNLFIKPKSNKKDDVAHIKNNIFGPNIIHQVDLLFLPTSQYGYKYALVAADVFNSKIDAIALKNKEPQSIIKGLKDIYTKHSFLDFPLIMQFDSGSEFKNNELKDFLKKENVGYKYTLTNRHKQNAIVENANGRLGSLIMIYQAEKELKTGKESKAWHKDLDKFVEYLNKKIKPSKKKYDPFEDVKGNDTLIKLLNVGDKVRKALDYPIQAHNDKRLTGRFRAGDIRYSKNLFTVKRVILNPGTVPLYQLNKPNSDEIDYSVAYTRNDLLLEK